MTAFVNIEIGKREFHLRKNIFLIEDVDLNNIQICSMVSSGKQIINILLVTKTMIVKLNHYK